MKYNIGDIIWAKEEDEVYCIKILLFDDKYYTAHIKQLNGPFEHNDSKLPLNIFDSEHIENRLWTKLDDALL